MTGLYSETSYEIYLTGFSDIAESLPTEPIVAKTTALPKITKINVPQRLDLYVDETKQLDVNTVPAEAMRAYEHVNKAVLDSSVVKISGDKITGVSDVNDETLGRNYVLNSGNIEPYTQDYEKIPLEKNCEISEFGIKNAIRIKTDNPDGSYKWYCRWGISEKAKDNSKLILQFYVKNLTSKRKTIALFDLKGGVREFFVEPNEAKKITLELTNSMFEKEFRIALKSSDEDDDATPTDTLISNLILAVDDKGTNWTPAPEDNYSYTAANVTFNDAEKSSAEFDIFVHERKRMTSPTESDTANFIL